MTTNIVRDSIVGDQWIQESCRQSPVQRILDSTGNFTGNILTGPVRLAFADLFVLPKKRDDATSEPKFGTTVLFPPVADLRIFQEEFHAVCGREFPDKFSNGQYYGIRSPFRPQDEKLKFSGFTPGCTFISCNSKFKPPVVDIRYNPIVDQSKVYSGVWAILAVNAYAYKDTKNSGVAFGLQSVMIIGDDTKFEAGAPDPKDHFAAVNVQAPIIRPDFAQMPMGAAPAPAMGIPGYTAPGGGVVGGYVPPAPQMYQQPQAYAPQLTAEQQELRDMGLL